MSLPLVMRVAAGLCLALSVAACQEQVASQTQQVPPPTVTVAKPIVREVVEDDEFVGRFEAVDEVEVRARVGGYLDEVHFTDGQIVAEGAALFTIDQRPFQTALTQAEAQLKIAETRLDFAKTQFERARELVDRGSVPVSTLDERQQEFLAAQASVEAAQANVERARLDMEYTEITAPIAGRIDRRRVSAGNLVQADGVVLTTIVSLDPIDFYFDVDERSLLRYNQDARTRGSTLQEGAGDLEVEVQVADTLLPAFPGKLNFAENRVDGESGTMRVRARLPNPDLILQPGLFGRVNVPASLPHLGILVPDEAVAADQDRRVVYVVDEAGKVSAKPVRPGPRLYGYRVIREGLTGDETIVVNGLMRIRPGAVVTPQLIDLPAEAS